MEIEMETKNFKSYFKYAIRFYSIPHGYISSIPRCDSVFIVRYDKNAVINTINHNGIIVFFLRPIPNSRTVPSVSKINDGLYQFNPMKITINKNIDNDVLTSIYSFGNTILSFLSILSFRSKKITILSNYISFLFLFVLFPFVLYEIVLLSSSLLLIFHISQKSYSDMKTM